MQFKEVHKQRLQLTMSSKLWPLDVTIFIIYLPRKSTSTVCWVRNSNENQWAMYYTMQKCSHSFTCLLWWSSYEWEDITHELPFTFILHKEECSFITLKELQNWLQPQHRLPFFTNCNFPLMSIPQDKLPPGRNLIEIVREPSGESLLMQ